MNGAAPLAEPDDVGGCVKGLADDPTAVAGGVLISAFCPKEKAVEIAGADAVRLKLRAFVSTFGASFAKRFEALVDEPNVNPELDPLDWANGLTGVAPNPKLMVPAGFAASEPLESIRVGLASMLMPSSGFEGGVAGRAGAAPKEKCVEVVGVAAGVGASPGLLTAPNANAPPLEDLGAAGAGAPKNGDFDSPVIGGVAGCAPKANGVDGFEDSAPVGTGLPDGVPNGKELVPPKTGFGAKVVGAADESLGTLATGGAPKEKAAGFCSVLLGA